MKGILKLSGTVFTTILCFLLVAYTACKKKTTSSPSGPCTGIVCQNNGTCLNGECQCIPGYEGLSCEKASNSRYLGKWNVTEKIIGSSKNDNKNKTKNYVLTIAKGEYNLDLLFNNLSNVYNGVKAVFSRKYNGTQVEYDSNLKFILNINQPVEGSANNAIISIGAGSVNDFGTDLTATFHVSYKEGSIVVVDTIDLSATIVP